MSPAEFATYAEYTSSLGMEYSIITANDAEQLFSLTQMMDKFEAVANSVPGAGTDDANKGDTVITIIPGMPTTIRSLVRAVLRTCNKSGGKYNVDPGTQAGDLNIKAIEELVTAGVITETEKFAFLSLGQFQEQPISEAAYNTLRAQYLIEPVEVTYPDARTNLLKVGLNAFDIAITITDEVIPDGLYFEATIQVNEDVATQNDPAAYADVDNTWRIRVPGTSKVVHYLMPVDYSHKTYNKIFIKPSVPVNFTVSAK